MTRWYHRALIGFAVGLLVSLIVHIVYRASTEPRVAGVGCARWVADCAQHRPLADCKRDAKELGCK